MQQLTIDFTTASPINVEKLKGQNRTIYMHLASGETITVLKAYALYRIMHLHSRISDLRHKVGVVIYDRMIQAKDYSGNPVSCKEYSLSKFSL